MAIRRSIELFGDDDANGPRAPIDLNPGAGLGAQNRAVAFAEGLTSACVNRTTYALALNDDDLNARIGAFEAGGLDTVYRLGEQNQPGGGRVVHIDGGAIEARAAPATNYAMDRANACFRARIEDATIDGGGGFDFVARAGGSGDASPGRGGWGYLDRRAIVFPGPTTRLALTQAGTLNPNGAGAALVSVAGGNGGYFGASGESLLVPNVDLLEILDTLYAGLYVVTSTTNDTRVPVVRLDGTAPNFAPNTEVTFRVFRPVFSTAAGRFGASPTYGVRFVGMPGESDTSPAVSLLQPSASSLLVAGYTRTGVRVFSVDGAGAILGGAATLTGALQASSLTISGGGALTGIYQVNGVLNVAGDVSATGAVSTTGALSASTLDVAGHVNAGTMTAAGLIRAETFEDVNGVLGAFDGNLTGDLHVSGTGTFGGEVKASAYTLEPAFTGVYTIVPALCHLIAPYGQADSVAWAPGVTLGSIRGAAGGVVYLTLMPWLYPGSLITKIEVRVQRQANTAAPGDGVRAELLSLNVLGSPPTLIALSPSVYDDGTKTVQTLTVTPTEPTHVGPVTILRLRAALNSTVGSYGDIVPYVRVYFTRSAA